MRANDPNGSALTPQQALAYATAMWEQYLDQKVDSSILTQAWRACCAPLETDIRELQLMAMSELRGAR